jgi:hypothetical protein
LAVGITVIVSINGVVPVLLPVKAGTEAEPLVGTRPRLVLPVAVHPYVVPVTREPPNVT